MPCAAPLTIRKLTHNLRGRKEFTLMAWHVASHRFRLPIKPPTEDFARREPGKAIKSCQSHIVAMGLNTPLGDADPSRPPGRSSNSMRSPWEAAWLCLRLSRAQNAPAGVDRNIAQLFLNADELVVFRDTIGPRKRARLDLAAVGRNRQIGDGRILRLA